MKRLHVVFIRPSRYDDEGYVVRFARGVLPSNTLCCLESLTERVAERRDLGPDVQVTVDVFDDTVQRIPVHRIAKLSRRTDTTVVVGFVGVQSNQFMRASDLALELREHGVQVMIGGFHVSGVLTLFEKPSYELQRLLDHGVTLVKGEVEAEGVMAMLLGDAINRAMKPIYNITEWPDLAAAPVPRASKKLQGRYVGKQMATIDTSRGCPFNCSFCTIINVQGRRMRYRSSALVLKAIEENYAHGVRFYFFTDDNFSRNPVWNEIFEGLIALRNRGIKVQFMMQTDTQAHRIPNFVEKAAEAGCYLAFIGMESVNPENLKAVGKRQNHTHEYVQMVENWHNHGILVHVGYIIGLPFDSQESVRHDMDYLRNQIKVDLASLFMLTPLPGSRDHWQMIQDHVPVDGDYNEYDGLHETFRHELMPNGAWRAAYDEAMNILYSKENIIAALLRTTPQRYWEILGFSIWYRYSALIGAHPMATGIFRLKDRRSRRPIFPRENVLQYGWRRMKDSYHGLMTYLGLFFEFQEVWMLTRKPSDPRWATLADLRERWSGVQRRIAEYDLQGRYADAAQELKVMLSSTADRLRQLSRASGHVSFFVRRNLQKKAAEVESYLRTFDVQMPGWNHVADAERFVSQTVIAGYEEIAIRYVAKRRQFNAFRRDSFERIKAGRLLSVNLLRVPYAMVCEIFFASRFAMHFLARI
ncbi:MAG: radical SAM protein [Candidatus Hydrogenedentes bacterium]|nr:radical SAM protein [Candidatus Hydrogenedentota bacterium]